MPHAAINSESDSTFKTLRLRERKLITRNALISNLPSADASAARATRPAAAPAPGTVAAESAAGVGAAAVTGSTYRQFETRQESRSEGAIQADLAVPRLRVPRRFCAAIDLSRGDSPRRFRARRGNEKLTRRGARRRGGAASGSALRVRAKGSAFKNNARDRRRSHRARKELRCGTERYL